MNHLQVVVLSHEEINIELKPTHKALYSTLKEANLNNRLENLLEELSHLNIHVLYVFLKHLSGNNKSIDQLMDMNIPLDTLAQSLADCITMISTSKK